MASIVVNGDTSGSVTLSAPATAGTVTVTLPATSGTMLTTASSTGVSGSAISSGTVAEAYGGTGTSTGYYGFKNRLINGAMVIDQRNAGASITPGSGFVYTVDRFYVYGTQASKFTVQQKNGVDSSASNYEASSTPAGFRNSTKITVASAFSPAATDQFFFGQSVEGLNVADLGFGTANAQSVTLSFWVKSSLTGQFSAFIENEAGTQSWVAPYTISVANTWQKVSITATGSTTGVWQTNTSNGMYVAFSLGCGTNFNTTANSWQAGNYHSTSSDVVFVSNASATLYITGVQLEKGSTATSFDYRPYTTEVSLCQRYYEKSYNLDVVPGTSGAAGGTGFGGSNTGTTTGFLGTSFVSYKVTKRVAGTITGWDNAGAVGKSSRYQLGVSGSNNQNWTLSTSGTQSFQVYSSGTSSDTGFTYSWSCDAEL